MAQLPQWTGYLVTVAGSGGVGSVLTSLFMRRKVDADAANAWSDTYSELIQELRTEIRELRAENKEFRVRIRELETEVASLRARELGQG